jgi:hypothetical protein
MKMVSPRSGWSRNARSRTFFQHSDLEKYHRQEMGESVFARLSMKSVAATRTVTTFRELETNNPFECPSPAISSRGAG